MNRERIANHPTITVGDGSRSLVVLPGLDDALGLAESSWFTRLVLRRYYRPFTDTHTVHVVSRPRGLSAESTREMAADYAEVLDELGPADVLGVSMGGLIAQHLGAERSENVERLVIGVAAHRLGEEGRRTVEGWRELGREERWGELYRDTIRVTYADRRRQVAYRALARLPIETVSRPASPDDFLVSATACLEHDTGDVLSGIAVPTLVIGGDEDVLFPADLLVETADRIPGATLRLLPGTGHGAFEERKGLFDASVRGFLSG